MDDLAATNQLWALTLIDAFVSAGIRHAVISPGSRSTPLALACERHPGIAVHVVLDERSAAFFALGLAKAEGRPALVVATSGSAPANWFPAVVEAAAGAQPMILLSADRPPELRECGANQTVDQLKLFGGQVRFSYEFAVPAAEPALLRQVAMMGRQAVARSLAPLPGPVHLNLPFREPLVAQAPADFEYSPSMPSPQPLLAPSPVDIAAAAAMLSGQPGLIVCGPADCPADFPAALTALAARLDCPVFADPLSGLRFGAHDRSRILTRYDGFLRGRDWIDARKPAWILRFGAMPVSKPLQQYLAAQDAAHHLLVDAHGRWSDPLHRTTWRIHADPAACCTALENHPLQAAPKTWFDAFANAERQAEFAAVECPPPEAQIIRHLLDGLPQGAQLFCGNSMPVRDLDGFSGSSAKSVRVVANRGASGIDGNLATVLGMAAAGQGKTVALLGDLALCHDAGALLAARGRDVTLVVLNNGGGGIFGYLPQAGLAEYQKLWLTPQQIDFAALAQAYGVAYAHVESPDAFEAAFRAALASGGATLVEVRVDLDTSIARHRAYWESLQG